MPKYSRFKYGKGYYGAAPSQLAYSVEPFAATVLDYSVSNGVVTLSWAPPTGTFSAMRIVRNQDNIPETAEDGVIIFNEPSTSEFIGALGYRDTVNSPHTSFVGGRFAYYRAWLRKADNIWYPAGDTYVLIPSDHSSKTSKNTAKTILGRDATKGYNDVGLLSTHDRFMDYLPRVFTSKSQSAIDEVDKDSVLYDFLGAFTFAMDEILTYADTLLPEYSGRSLNPQIIDLHANMLGLTQEPELASKSQKKMIREARYMYPRKGTYTALSTLVESVTGFAPEINVGQNVMISMQDSTFYEGIGNWESLNATITAVENTDTPNVEARAIDRYWHAEVAVSSIGGLIANGLDKTFTRGTPVYPEREYTFSYYVKGAGAVVPSITWYDQFANVISTDVGDGITSTTSWQKDDTAVFTSPVGATFAAVTIEFGATGTFLVDMCQVTTSGQSGYEEARVATITLNPSKQNLVANPSFELWDAGVPVEWTVVGLPSQEVATLSAAMGSFGESSMLELTPDGGELQLSTDTIDGGIPVRSFYTLSMYVQAPVANQVFTLSITADDGEITPITFTSPEFTATATWTRFHTTIYVPEGFNSNTLVITSELTGISPTELLNIDNVQLETTYSPSDYFDGSLGFVNGAMWVGTEHQSSSVLYPNRLLKIPRLIEEVQSYIPRNTPYVIETVVGVEFKGITK